MLPLIEAKANTRTTDQLPLKLWNARVHHVLLRRHSRRRTSRRVIVLHFVVTWCNGRCIVATWCNGRCIVAITRSVDVATACVDVFTARAHVVFVEDVDQLVEIVRCLNVFKHARSLALVAECAVAVNPTLSIWTPRKVRDIDLVEHAVDNFPRRKANCNAFDAILPCPTDKSTQLAALIENSVIALLLRFVMYSETAERIQRVDVERDLQLVPWNESVGRVVLRLCDLGTWCQDPLVGGITRIL